MDKATLGQSRRRYRHHDLPPRGDWENGHGQRSDGGGRRAAVLLWARRLAGRRRLDHANDHVGQHQYADRDDRGERCRDDPRGWAIAPALAYYLWGFLAQIFACTRAESARSSLVAYNSRKGMVVLTTIRSRHRSISSASSL